MGRKASSILYFDHNVYHPVASQGAGGRVKKLLKDQGAEAFASTQNLIEAWRISDDDTLRANLVRTIIQVARDREEMPLMLEMVRAVVGQMRHLHPDWIRPDPDLRLQRRDIRRRREAWDRVKADPAYVPKGVPWARAFLKEAVVESRRRQAAYRELRRSGGRARNPPRIQALIDALPEPEAFWRREQGLAWWDAVMPDPRSAKTTEARRVGDLRDWLLPYVVRDRVDVESWVTFWLAELREGAVAPLRVASLVDFFNRDRKSDPGDWGDINHAAFAVGRDYLLTADRNFYESLLKARVQSGVTMATPKFINRAAAEIVAEIRSVMGW